MVAKCTSAGPFTGKRTIGKLPLLKKNTSQAKQSRGAASDIPQNLAKSLPCWYACRFGFCKKNVFVSEQSCDKTLSVKVRGFNP